MGELAKNSIVYLWVATCMGVFGDVEMYIDTSEWLAA